VPAMKSRSRFLLKSTALSGLFIAPIGLQAAPGTASQADAVQLEEVTVQGRGETATGQTQGYVARRTATGTKTDTPVIETPQTISTITRQQIQDQAALTVSQALRYEPGVAAETRGGNRTDSVYIRGFGGFGGNASYVQYLDNLRLPKGVSYALPSIDPYLLERIDVLQGPASVLYGQSNPGGLINLVSKRPLDVQRSEVLARFGTDSHFEGGFDITGPVPTISGLSYRLITLGRDADTSVNYSKDQRVFVASMLTFAPDAATTFAIQGLYQRDPNSFQTNWMPALGTLQANPNGKIPYNFFSGDPSYNTFNREQTAISYQFEHRFNDVFAARQNLRFMHLGTNFEALSVLPNSTAFAAAASCGGFSSLCLGRQSTHYVERADNLNVDNELEARFFTGAFRHVALAGVDYQWTNANALYGNGTTTYLNYLRPVYTGISAPALTTSQRQNNTQLGAYGEDQIQYGSWHLQLGVRNDWSDVSALTTTLATGSGAQAINRSSATTWRAGLLYKFDNGLAPFVDYATSFEPTSGTGYGGTAFVPTTGKQIEGGIKYQPDNFPGLFTLTGYDMTQYNVLTTDTVHTSTNTAVTLCSTTTCQAQTGAIRSTGVELSAKTTPLPGLNLIASYAYVDVRVQSSPVVTNGIAVQGKHPVGAPDQTAGFWGDYTIQGGPMRGFGFGGGVRYIGQSYGDTINTTAMRVPSYTLFDAQIHYDLIGLHPRLAGMKAAVNVSNLFDKHYVSACASEYQCFYGTSRTVLGTLTYTW